MITGATGYVASNLIKYIPKQDIIYAVVRAKYKECFHSSKHLNYVYCDMDNYNTLWEQIPQSIDCIIHCAWEGARGSNNHNEFIQRKNTIGTIKLWESALKLKCKLWIQIGSLAEYGVSTNQEIILSEQVPPHPKSFYAKAKYECAVNIFEKCQRYNINFCEIRLGSVYGPQMPKSTLIQYVLDNLLSNKNIQLSSSCTQMWEFIYILDVVYILNYILHNGINKTILNVSNGEADILKNFIIRMKNTLLSNSSITFGKDKADSFGCENIWCDITILKKYLGEYKFTSFEEGIAQIMDAANNKNKIF